MVFRDLDAPLPSHRTWIENLHSHENWQDIPTIFFGQQCSPEQRARGFDLGGSDYLEENTDLQEVTARLRAHLNSKRRLDALRQRHRVLERLAITDPLSGLHNRAYFDTALDREIARSKRRSHPLCLLLIDVDHFKRINDTYGHTVGDNVIRRVATILSDTARDVDTICRYGGEEFAALLPETTLTGATTLADRFRKKVRATLAETCGLDFPVSISIGISCALADRQLPARQLVELADRALYRAKDRGRNRVEVVSPPPAAAPPVAGGSPCPAASYA